MTSAMTQPRQRRRKSQTKYGLGLEHKKIKYTSALVEGTSPDMIVVLTLTRIMIRGDGCAIRSASTQKWAAATYLAIGTTQKKLRRDTTTKTRSHNPQIYTTISSGCVIVCTPGDKSMVCQHRPQSPPGFRIMWGGGCLMYG